MSYFMGIDIGSGTSKGVITSDGNVRADFIIHSGVNYRKAAEKVREGLLSQLGLRPEHIAFTVVTGQSAAVPIGDAQVVDIRCCARGINKLFPEARTVIDVQGQSSQVIRISEQGQVINFAVGEKCASGSGRFLDVIANVLQIDLKDMGAISLKSKSPVAFTTGCAVFGESEVVSRVADGVPVEDILAGVHKALADRISALADRVGLEEPCAISGGGALNIELKTRIEEKLKVKLLVPLQPQMVNALGAAVIAEEMNRSK
jgi:(R)-2-hydroxyacyl-CoA dehydratese activating ATPase